MLASDFDYSLPEHLIAQEPADRRDLSRMMVVYRESESIEHHLFEDIGMFLQRGDLLARNDTKVVPARLEGRKETGGRVELLFVEEIEKGVWEVLLKASRRPKPGGMIRVANDRAKLRMLEDGENGYAKVALESSSFSTLEILERYGSTPLPPYIKRSENDQRSELDRNRYQTVYARSPGAVAAPTAGLHFTPEIFARLKAKGVESANITLHVGPGTFKPVSTEHVEEHSMDSERYEISSAAARTIQSCDGKVVALGSTSVRTLETVAHENGEIVACSGRSGLFIYPPFQFKAVDAILTNFHLPRSTLLMMISAFGGRDLIMRAYREAVKQEYRFYSYGDCMLIL